MIVDHNKRNERMKSLLKDLAGKFLQINSNGTSLLTVTDVMLSKDAKYATIFFTVLPDEKTEEALNFTKRNRTEFSHFVKENSRIGFLPKFDFKIDLGEKHRQKIDELFAKDESSKK